MLRSEAITYYIYFWSQKQLIISSLGCQYSFGPGGYGPSNSRLYLPPPISSKAKSLNRLGLNASSTPANLTSRHAEHSHPTTDLVEADPCCPPWRKQVRPGRIVHALQPLSMI